MWTLGNNIRPLKMGLRGITIYNGNFSVTGHYTFLGMSVGMNPKIN